MLFVIPGFPLITGGLDMAKIDFPSGVQRLTYVLCIILMATLAGWMVASIVHLNPQGFEPLGLNPVINCLLRMLFAFIGVWGFSVMFNSPQRMCLVAATIGAITDTLRLETSTWACPRKPARSSARSLPACSPPHGVRRCATACLLRIWDIRASA